MASVVPMQTEERIRVLESYLDALLGADPAQVREDPELCRMLAVLEDYYTGGQWLQDYTQDEQGLLSSDLKRGILSQDTLYDLLTVLKEESACEEAVSAG